MMGEIINFLQKTGNITFEYFWFPLLLWTAIAIPIIVLLRRIDAIPPVYQHHSRVALLLTLPLAMVSSYLVEIIEQAVTSAEATTKFIVIQNPITISAVRSEAAIRTSFSEPMFWMGVTGVVVAAGMIYGLMKIVLNGIQLKKLRHHLSFTKLQRINRNGDIKYSELNALVAFSDQTDIPFTYGWRHPKIIIPTRLENDSDKVAMVIRHELMHIKHNDFLLNGIQLIIKAIFWFHPLVHYLHNSSRDFREITCDAEVLAEASISKRRYAALLFDLAECEYKNSNLAMSMAVNPSTLKKRIHIMTTQNISTDTFRSSLMLIFTIACLIVLTISCSDISDEDGMTNTEFQQTQSQMKNLDLANPPLIVINGERFTETDALSRINPNYMQSVAILKGKEAKEAYGESGRNGVIKIQLKDGIDKETVISDLNQTPDTGVMSTAPSNQKDFFLAVEKMPELIGGLADLQKKLKYPEEARKNNIQGRVIVQFIVSEQGEVTDPQILKGIGHGCDQEVLRVVREAKFKPGKQQGQTVPVQYSLPMSFKFHDDNNASKDKSSSYIEAPADKEKWADIRNLSYSSESGKMEGRVFDTITNKPLPGVNVRIMETSIGGSTDFRGKFKLEGLHAEKVHVKLTYADQEPFRAAINSN